MNNLRKTAVALRYEQDKQTAPKVLATGKGIVADNILEKAQENQVPIQHDPTLVELLGQLEINEVIPEELFGVVAEVFAFVYQLDQKKSEK